MEIVLAMVIAMLLTIIFAVGGCYIWFYYTGWTAFTHNTGDSPQWLPANDKDVSRLRFNNCLFTVTRADGVVGKLNVDVVLNSMAVAFKPNATSGTNPSTLNLVKPLNPFSFVIPGFNDKITVPDPTAALWCITCPQGATVSLTGEVRTI